MSAFTRKQGFVANGVGAASVAIVLDATDAKGDGSGATFTAADTVTIPVPVGFTAVAGDIVTGKAWTGTIDAGKTGTTQALANGATPSAVVGEAINLAAVDTTPVHFLTAATANIVLTINSTNATGKITVYIHGFYAKAF